MKDLIHIVLFLTVSVIHAQDTLTVFDRPGVADSPYITDSENWQFETGLAYSENGGLSEAILPSAMLRKSFLGANELRIAFNYEPQMMALINRHISLDQDPIAIGIKRKILRESGFIPEASLLVNTYYPMQEISALGKTGTYNAELGFQFQNNLNEIFALNYNFGGIITDHHQKGILSYSLCLNITATDNLGFFTEIFGYSPLDSSQEEIGFDFGCVFNPTSNTQIDLSYITNYYNNSSYGSLLIGYSFILK
jgi:hypothetical protein